MLCQQNNRQPTNPEIAMNRKMTHVAAVVAALSLAGAASAQQEVVRIGHVAPLSGGIAHLGKDNENGARLAIEDLNARKLTINGRAVRFELMSEDDAADPKQGTAAAQKLVDANFSVIDQPAFHPPRIQHHFPGGGR
jgi:branched-chain amino acid transport system substrate-binding protein